MREYHVIHDKSTLNCFVGDTQGIRAHLFCQGIYRDSQVIDLNGSMGLYRDYLILYQRQVFKVIDLNGL